ncbi:MAG: adenosine deaminase, partial [Candidatus Marinimicrobia bacterium]|nr:adenosine deaminase [Candidatus Neomarinimicrobiota bacterium]
PKAELHCHLDGSLRLDTILDLSEKNKIELPTRDRDTLKKYVTIGDRIGSLEDYIGKFELPLKLLQTPEALERVAYELAEDVWNDGVRYIEVRYSPILHTVHGMTSAESIEAVKRGLDRAEVDLGIGTGIIICGIRSISPEVSLRLADLAVQFKHKGVVGFDLAGAEENFPAKHHMEAFFLILNNNINTTLHAGEAFGPDSIHQAIHYCGAHRIGHGTRLMEDQELMHYVNDHRLTLEVCLTSNVHTKSVRSLKEHPFKYYYDQGIRVTLNTDNLLVSNTTLSREYLIAKETFGLTLNDFRDIIINGFKASFISHQERRKVIGRVVEELEAEFGIKRLMVA